MLNQDLYQKAIKVLVAELLTVRKEKMSISYFLHEDLLQCLVAVKGFLPSILSKNDSSIPRSSVIIQVLDDSINKIRDVYDRIMIPPVKEVGLKQVLLDRISELTKKTPIKVEIRSYDKEIDNLEEYYLFILYRICNEIITNAFIYSNAKKISMSLVKRYADISIGIEDNGIGFGGKISSWKGGLVKCFLTIDQLGGTMDIITAPGKGCMFIARIPCGVKYSDILDKINNGGGVTLNYKLVVET